MIANKQKTEQYKQIAIIVDDCDAKKLENEFKNRTRIKKLLIIKKDGELIEFKRWIDFLLYRDILR